MDRDDVRFFVSPDELRDWLEVHHDSEHELWVGFHRTKSGHPSITWPEAVDEALCFGWIDGNRKSIDGGGRGEAVPGQRQGLAVLRVPTSFVPARMQLVGGQPQAGGNPG